VQKVEFLSPVGSGNELHLFIDFPRGSRFADEAGALCPVHDTVPRRWQHLSFFQHTCYLHCSLPRITGSDGKVVTVTPPWARSGSGFTLLFEALALALIEREMPVNRVAQIMHVLPQRIWTVFNHWVGEARLDDDSASITRLGVDETSTKKGRHYVTLVVDMDEHRVIHVVSGKGKGTIAALKEHLAGKGVGAAQIEEVSMDLSPAYIAGVAEYFPKAQITFDRFHVVKLLNEAMDQVRKSERAQHEALKGHKYTFLKNPQNLSDAKRQELAILIEVYPSLGEAYRLKILFNDLWTMPSKEAANAFLNQWCSAAQQADIPVFDAFVKTLKAHWEGIIHFAQSMAS
jgi:transposase